ncbi:hypothetical protein DV515_00010280 [Chloebia gouldiae]|uniref:Uncharacterized protein n=1 Tax=Chloebia gouldiae TaxID=44316 RepID=A0A3L8SAM6_CHLGU|nr:hypothetical protein DV515_00010280 [Chloebia gouldiae]
MEEFKSKSFEGRLQSLIDCKSYTDTKQPVAWILEQSCSISPYMHDLVENINSTLKSEEKHMAEVVPSATFLKQQATSLSHVVPYRLHPGLLCLESCGDLSTSTTEGEQLAERRIQRAKHERPHSVIGVLLQDSEWVSDHKMTKLMAVGGACTAHSGERRSELHLFHDYGLFYSGTLLHLQLLRVLSAPKATKCTSHYTALLPL